MFTELSKMFETTAKFFDKHYITLNTYMKSSDYTKKKNVIKRLEDNQRNLSSKENPSREERKQLTLIRENLRTDQEKLDKCDADRKLFLAKAIQYYGFACRYSSTESLCIFRIVSLWLNHRFVQQVQDIIEGKEEHEHEAVYELPNSQTEQLGLFDLLPSHIFLPILPQLSAHLTHKQDTYFDKEIYSLLYRIATDHPHHTLNFIMALSNSYADSKEKVKKDDAQVLGAKKLLKQLRNRSDMDAEMIDQLERMTKILIELANTNAGRGGQCAFDKNVDNIMKLKDLTAVQCPTVDLPVMKNRDYSGMTVTIVKWAAKYNILGGINAPKKIECICSDGETRSQLLKGNDDLRQDAVMQQVFNILNTMLRQNQKSVEKRLQVRTYKVIPFSRRSGMLEFCDNTTPIGAVLMNVHEKYRPLDKINPKQARSMMQQNAEDRKPPQVKLKTFENICEQLKPAFHHFFLSNFLTPGAFFERQYSYTNSVATNSIIGYILGIGDRHIQNILLDLTTSEVVHIDFGFAFEQAKSLPTPETVPFRLTRDIVAGMGVTGYEGLFRKSAELTMQVLRDNQNTIMAILEVLLYDPLYFWALTSEKVRRTQSLDGYDMELNPNTNTSADRALELCRDKLNGSENGIFGGNNTVETQVERLINEATSNHNLSRLFHGWQAYL